MANHNTQINQNSFWNTDLEEVEKTFLKKGQKITDLPTKLINNVPPQGSVLLGRVVNIDDVIKTPSFISRIKYFLSK